MSAEGLPATEVSEPVKLHVEFFIKSKAKMFFGLLPTKQIVRGQKFKITLKARNMSKTESFNGKLRVEIQYPTHDKNIIELARLRPWKPWEEMMDEPELDAFSEGFALVSAWAQGDKPVEIVDDAGENIDGKSPGIGGFHVTTAKDIYAFYAVILTLGSLLIIVTEKIVSLLNFFLRNQP